jgi:hypothetical protein
VGIEHFKNQRFRVTVRDFSGGLNSGVVGSHISDNEFATFKNFLIDRPKGPARKRGAITSIHAVGGEALAYYPGTVKSGSTNNLYYTYSAGGALNAYDTNDTPTILIAATSDISGGAGKAVLMGETLFIPTAVIGNALASGVTPLPVGPVVQTYGTKHAAHSTGTATFTTDSATVSFSSATLTASMVGSYIINTTDSAATMFAYRIIAVAGTFDSVTLDRVYKGSGAGGGDAYTIRSAEYLRVCPDIFAAAASYTAVGNMLSATQLASFQGRLFAADTVESGSRKLTRLRWSDLDGGTSNGTAPFTGICAWSSTAFVDLPELQRIQHLEVYQDSLYVFGKTGIVVIRGVPTYSTRGSMEVVATYYGFNVASYVVSTSPNRCVCATPYGLYFWDVVRGLCVIDGGYPKIIDAPRKAADTLGLVGPTTIGYHRDHLIMFADSGSVSGWMYNIRTDTWSEIPAATSNTRVRQLQPGRSVLGEEILVGLNNTTTHIADYGNMIDSPGDAATDAGGGAITAELTTKSFGIPGYKYQIDKAIVVYKLTDLTTTNPYIALTVSTGLPGATNDTTSASTVFAETTTPEQKIWDNMGVVADALVRGKALQTNNCGVFELHALIIEGSYEGEYPST